MRRPRRGALLKEFAAIAVREVKGFHHTSQRMLWDRRVVYTMLQRYGVPVPRHVFCNRDGWPNTGGVPSPETVLPRVEPVPACGSWTRRRRSAGAWRRCSGSALRS